MRQSPVDELNFFNSRLQSSHGAIDFRNHTGVDHTCQLESGDIADG